VGNLFLLVGVLHQQAKRDILALEMGEPHAWIGFTDEASEGNLVWVTGETVTYTNWYPGEPNDQLDEDYTIMHSSNHVNPGSWADQPNSVNRYPVILEIE
jgi:hypothetical protein